MTDNKKRVAVAMSGGVDSSVAAALLLRRGYDVTGVTMRLYSGDEGVSLASSSCCVLGADDARAVCEVLGIPHQVLNLEREFESSVIDYFCADYERGRTPNPCLACNEHLKFEVLLQWALDHGFDFLATGHYARIERSEDGYRLRRAVDDTKDQSYALFTLGQRELAHLLFPLGGYRKEEARRLAQAEGLPVAEKPDSMEICFVADDYRSFVEGRVCQEPGEIRDTAGRLVGQHRGLAAYTVGQRRGLGFAAGEKRYVVALDRESNVVTVGGEDDLLSDWLLAEDLRWVSGVAPAGETAVEAKVRYRSPVVAARVRVEAKRAAVRFDEPQRAVTPGQAVVFYRGEDVLGGGIIARALSLHDGSQGGAG